MIRICLLTALGLLLFLPAQGKKSEPKATLIEGTMARGTVAKVIEAGPQRFIASVRVEPHTIKGKFIGYRLVGVATDGPLVNSQSVLPGDVIISVNHEPLERPDQFMRAWEVAKSANTLQILLLRGTQRLLYRWKLTP
jgi:type II secretory pathway component PulC